jgi:uncharacterized membrane protein
MAQSHILVGASETRADPAIRRIGATDLMDALAKGLEDFSAMPSHALFLCVMYPLIGMLLAGLTLGFAIVPLLYPLAAGFALLGPVAALGLYELSRRREAGVAVSPLNALDVLRSPSIGAIVALAVLLMILFLIWLATANAIYVANFGYAPPASVGQFLHDVLFTPAGRNLILLGNGIGFLFAVVVLTISVVSFPLLLERDAGAVVALLTSVRAVRANPLTMALWGLLVAALLFVGSLPLFIGLPVVLPVLGHATWLLFRKVVEPDPNRSQSTIRGRRGRATRQTSGGAFPVGAERWRAARCRSLGWPGRMRRRPGAMPPRPPRKPAANHVEHRREDQAECGDADHAGEHRSAQGLPQLGAGAHRPHHRRHAEDEGERGHQDRAEPPSASTAAAPGRVRRLRAAWRTRRSGSRSWRPDR